MQDPDQLRRFLRHLILAGSNIKESQAAHERLRKHIQRVKRLASEHPEAVHAEVPQLQRNIEEVIRHRKKVVVQHTQKPPLAKRLGAVEAKIDKVLATREERMKKIERLEKKIRGQQSKPAEDKDMQQRIKHLEIGLKQLSKKEKVDKKKIAALKIRISALKKKTKTRK